MLLSMSSQHTEPKLDSFASVFLCLNISSSVFIQNICWLIFLCALLCFCPIGQLDTTPFFSFILEQNVWHICCTYLGGWNLLARLFLGFTFFILCQLLHLSHTWVIIIHKNNANLFGMKVYFIFVQFRQVFLGTQTYNVCG